MQQSTLFASYAKLIELLSLPHGSTEQASSAAGVLLSYSTDPGLTAFFLQSPDQQFEEILRMIAPEEPLLAKMLCLLVNLSSDSTLAERIWARKGGFLNQLVLGDAPSTATSCLACKLIANVSKAVECQRDMLPHTHAYVLSAIRNAARSEHHDFLLFAINNLCVVLLPSLHFIACRGQDFLVESGHAGKANTRISRLSQASTNNGVYCEVHSTP